MIHIHFLHLTFCVIRLACFLSDVACEVSHVHCKAADCRLSYHCYYVITKATFHWHISLNEQYYFKKINIIKYKCLKWIATIYMFANDLNIAIAKKMQ